MEIEQRNKIRREQQMLSHGYAISLERILCGMRNINDMDRYNRTEPEKYGIQTEDIRYDLSPIIETLNIYLRQYPEKNMKVKSFQTKYFDILSSYSIDEILSIVDYKMLIDNEERSVRIENGAKYFEELMDDLRSIK